MKIKHVYGNFIGLYLNKNYYIVSKEVPKGIKKLSWCWYIDGETGLIYSAKRKKTNDSYYIVSSTDIDVLPLINN